jgi:phage tail protein X
VLRNSERAFADLVCADPAWVSAEFEAIIDANFGTAPTPRPRPRIVAVAFPEPAVLRGVRRAGFARSRQRSPPAR